MRAELVEEIERRVGPLDGASLREAIVGVVADETGFVAELTLSGASGRSEERLHDRSCQVVVRAAAVKIAIAVAQAREQLQARAAAVPPPPAPAPTCPPSADDLPPAPVSDTPRPTPPAPARWHVGIRGRAGLDAGTLPGFGPSYALDVIAHWRWLRLETGVNAIGPRGFRQVADARVGADMWTARAHLTPCGGWSLGGLEPSLCASFELGTVAVRPVGLDRPQTRALLQAAVGPGARLAYVSGRLALWLGAELLVPLPRRTFAIGDRRVARELAPVSSRVWLGVEVRFATRGPRRSRAP